MPPLLLSSEEAVAVYLGTSLVEEMWGTLYSEPARGALAKIDNLLPDDQRKEVTWAKRSLIATGMHRADFSSITLSWKAFDQQYAKNWSFLCCIAAGRSHDQPAGMLMFMHSSTAGVGGMRSVSVICARQFVPSALTA